MAIKQKREKRTELVHSTVPAGVTELLVQVVGTSTRVVAEEDTKVLDLQGLLLVDL